MLEILEVHQSCKQHLEKDKNGLILVSDKIHPLSLAEFSNDFYDEKCYFKGKDGLKIEIVHSSLTQKLGLIILAEMESGHHCKYESPCPTLLKMLGLLFEVKFTIEKNSLTYIVQMPKIHPLLLGCLRQYITEMPLYFTMTSIRNYGTA